MSEMLYEPRYHTPPYSSFILEFTLIEFVIEFCVRDTVGKFIIIFLSCFFPLCGVMIHVVDFDFNVIITSGTDPNP